MPAGTFVPLTNIPGTIPVLESTVTTLAPESAYANCDVFVPVGTNTNVPDPETVGAADNVSVFPDTETTVVPPANVPVPPEANSTVAPGANFVPSGTVTVVEPELNESPESTCATGKPISAVCQPAPPVTTARELTTEPVVGTDVMTEPARIPC